MAYISLDFDAYRENLKYLGKKVGDTSKIMAVLKDNAYGHGIDKMAPLAAASGVKRAVVKDTREALIVAPFFEKVLILIESSPNQAKVDEKIAYAADELKSLNEFPKGTTIHLKIDTGMRRNGIMPSQIEEAFKLCIENELKLEGVFTHFYASDMLGSEFYIQNETYKNAKLTCIELAKKYSLDRPIFHSRNSAAILRIDNDFDDDFVRAGIASYGYTDLDKSFGEFPLKPVMSLWAKRLSTRELEKGDRVGYGGVFTAEKKMTISAYDLGYGDGFFRYDGLKELHVANGKKILGKMSMDSFSVEGDADEVCVFEDVTEFATHFNTISYEIMAKLSPFLNRVIKPHTNS